MALGAGALGGNAGGLLAAMLLSTAVGDATIGSRQRGSLAAEVQLSVAVWLSNVLTDMKSNHF